MKYIAVLQKNKLNALIECKVKNIAFDLFSRELDALRIKDLIELVKRIKGY